MSYYRTCPHCGSNLDSCETCDCVASRYSMLTPANREKFDALIVKLLEEQKTARGAANTTDGKAEQT